MNRVSLPADPAATAALLRKWTALRPKLAIVLGSGFHEVAARLRVETRIPCAKLPGFPRPSVQGHQGELLAGHVSRTPIFLLSGRAHFYEGHPMEVVTFPVRVLAAFGVRDLLLTNAAGGIHRRFR